MWCSFATRLWCQYKTPARDITTQSSDPWAHVLASQANCRGIAVERVSGWARTRTRTRLFVGIRGVCCWLFGYCDGCGLWNLCTWLTFWLLWPLYPLKFAQRSIHLKETARIVTRKVNLFADAPPTRYLFFFNAINLDHISSIRCCKENKIKISTNPIRAQESRENGSCTTSPTFPTHFATTRFLFRD